MLRRVLLALGFAFTAIGIAVAVMPSIAATLRLPDVPRVVVTALAVVFALATYAARTAVDFRDSDEAAVRTTGLEERYEPPRPGAEIDRELTVSPQSGRSTADTLVRERLRVLAVRVLSDAENWSKDEAHRHLDDGTWTDDRTAAALFSEDIDPSARHLVASFAGIESIHEREVRHTLAELERRSGVDAGGD